MNLEKNKVGINAFFNTQISYRKIYKCFIAGIPMNNKVNRLPRRRPQNV